MNNSSCGSFNGCSSGSWGAMRSYYILHKQSMACFENKEFQNAKDLCLKMLEIVPNDKIALYNLACADSLLGNMSDALVYLSRAIDAGYVDLEHMLNDEDLNHLKGTEEFAKIIKKIEEKITGYEPTTTSCCSDKNTRCCEDKNTRCCEDKNTRCCEESVKKEEECEKKEDDIPSEWKQKIDILIGMGCDYSTEILKDLLKQCEGSLEKVVNIIFNY